MFQASLSGEVSFCLSNFLLNLLNRTLNLPNLEKYFVDTDLLKELKENQTFYNQFNNKSNQKGVENAIHINLNPNKEMFILIQQLKYRCFCSTQLYDLVPGKKYLYSELRNECDEMYEILVSERKELFYDPIAAKNNLKHLETLENFEQIKNAYEKLKPFIEIKMKENWTDKEEDDGYKVIVELNEEFGNAFKKLLEEI
uniref:Uncharacterized protein n=1 Tax=Globodera pallida TaxID=36090 RepID=A0A183BIG2_GLOPA